MDAAAWTSDSVVYVSVIGDHIREEEIIFQQNHLHETDPNTCFHSSRDDKMWNVLKTARNGQMDSFSLIGLEIRFRKFLEHTRYVNADLTCSMGLVCKKVS
jgi:hypothetical protein